jgi:hypothetical protein
MEPRHRERTGEIIIEPLDYIQQLWGTPPIFPGPSRLKEEIYLKGYRKHDDKGIPMKHALGTNPSIIDARSV